MHGICANNNSSRTEQPKQAQSNCAPACSGFMPGRDSWKNPLTRSAKEQFSVQRLPAAHELRRLSADNLSDSSLHLKTQTTNCED